ncbi:phage shock protein PspA [Salinimonas chungwhensis]|uniref:phage shock protein PspA n=1 Tax=Salinimonas chungwhensis TaxID=265425 RepID=UPI000381EEFC|nr:phage shock protein PspA [Salinimonas chungwhensis]
MGMFSRVTDIINANINAMLDKAEDPQKMIRLMVQEMEEALAQARCISAQYIAQKKQLNRKAQELQKSEQRWHQKAQLAVTKNSDELARAALSEKQRVVREREQINDQVSVIDEQLAKLTDDIERLYQKLSDARQKARALAQRESALSTQLKVRNQGHHIQVQHAMARFESYQQKVERLEAEVESYELGRGNCSLNAQFAQLEQDADIEQELARMKKAQVA